MVMSAFHVTADPALLVPILSMVAPIRRHWRKSNRRSSVCKTWLGSLMLRTSSSAGWRSWTRLLSIPLWLAGRAEASPLARNTMYVCTNFMLE